MREQTSAGIFNFLNIPTRKAKPRETGMTLLIDRCLPTPYMEAFLNLNADLIDHIKIVDHAGMLTRYSPDWMKDRLKVFGKYGIGSLPSGFAFEVAYSQGTAYQFFDATRDLGFSAVEISEGLIPDIPLDDRKKMISYAKKLGLVVYTEIGRKFPSEAFDVGKSVETIQRDLALGVSKVTIEKGEILICKNNGSRLIHEIVEQVGLENVFLEPGPEGWPDLHKWVIENFGPEVNLENIEIDEVVRVEAARRGMDRLVEFSFLSKH